MNTKNWLIEWFSKNSDQNKDIIQENLHEDYLAKCWIDSLKFIELISDIENHFDIRFSNDDFQDRAFSTGNGFSVADCGEVERSFTRSKRETDGGYSVARSDGWRDSFTTYFTDG